MSCCALAALLFWNTCSHTGNSKIGFYSTLPGNRFVPLINAVIYETSSLCSGVNSMEHVVLSRLLNLLFKVVQMRVFSDGKLRSRRAATKHRLSQKRCLKLIHECTETIFGRRYPGIPVWKFSTSRSLPCHLHRVIFGAFACRTPFARHIKIF